MGFEFKLSLSVCSKPERTPQKALGIMFQYRKKRRELARQLAELDREWLPRIKNYNSHELTLPIPSNYLLERARIEVELERLDTAKLVTEAARYGIKLLPSESWTVDERFPAEAKKSYLSQNGKAELSQMIAEAQYNRAKKWVDLLSPVLTVLLSLLALIISIIALFRT